MNICQFEFYILPYWNETMTNLLYIVITSAANNLTKVRSMTHNTVQYVMYTDDRIQNAAMVIFACWHITPSHYNHYAKLFKTLNIPNACQVYAVGCLSKMN